MSTGPSRLLWVAWSLAVVGGGSVFAGLLIILRDPCVDAATATVAATCDGLPPLAVALALGGTAVAVVGGLLATVISLRRAAR